MGVIIQVLAHSSKSHAHHLFSQCGLLSTEPEAFASLQTARPLTCAGAWLWQMKQGGRRACDCLGWMASHMCHSISDCYGIWGLCFLAPCTVWSVNTGLSHIQTQNISIHTSAHVSPSRHCRGVPAQRTQKLLAPVSLLCL